MIARGLARRRSLRLFAAELSACKFGDAGGGGPDGGYDAIVPNRAPLCGVAGDAGLRHREPGIEERDEVDRHRERRAPGPERHLSANLSGGAAFVIDADGCSGTSLASAGACTISVHSPPGHGSRERDAQRAADPGGDATESLSGTGAGMGSLVIAPTAKDSVRRSWGPRRHRSCSRRTIAGPRASGGVSVSLAAPTRSSSQFPSDQCARARSWPPTRRAPWPSRRAPPRLDRRSRP